MTVWPTAFLGDVAEINPRLSSALASDEVVSFLGMVDASEDGTTTQGLDKAYDEVRKGFTPFANHDILVAKITPCFQNGKIVQAHISRPIGFGSTEFHVIRPKGEKLDHRYALHFLRQQYIRIDGERRMTGSGGQRRIPAEFLKALPIPLPPIHEQRRIAAILDHVDGLRVKRQEALHQLDDLAQSIFLDMFGNPATNPHVWPHASLNELLTRIESGKSPKCLPRPANPGEFGVLKLGAVTTGIFDATQNKALPQDFAPDLRTEVKRGDLLFTRKNTSDLVGACAIVDESPNQLLMPDLIFRLQINPESRMTAQYLYATLMYPSMRKRIQNLAGGSAGSMPNISKAKLLTVKIPQPPKDLQVEFSERVAQVKRIKDQAHASKVELDGLFSSLQSRAFQGEL